MEVVPRLQQHVLLLELREPLKREVVELVEQLVAREPLLLLKVRLGRETKEFQKLVDLLPQQRVAHYPPEARAHRLLARTPELYTVDRSPRAQLQTRVALVP